MSSCGVEWEDPGIRVTGAALLASPPARRQTETVSAQTFGRVLESNVFHDTSSWRHPRIWDPDCCLSRPSEDGSGLRSSIVALDTEGQSGAICCSVNTEPEKAPECLCCGSWSARSAGGQGRWYTSEWRLTSQH